MSQQLSPTPPPEPLRGHKEWCAGGTNEAFIRVQAAYELLKVVSPLT